MNRRWLVAVFALPLSVSLIVSFGAPAALADPSSITLHTPKHKPGEKWTEDKGQHTDLAVTVNNGTHLQTHNEESESTSVEVLKVSNNIVTQAKYTFTAFTAKSSAAGRDKSEPSVIAGKTYTLTAGDPLDVTASTGTASDAEVGLVRKLEKNFGKPEKMDAVLDGRTFARGTEVSLPESQIADALGDPDMKVAKLALTYKGLAGGNATFDMTMKLAGDKDGNHVSADLSGTMLVDPSNGTVLGVDMNGPMTVTGGKFSAQGTFGITERTKR